MHPTTTPGAAPVTVFQIPPVTNEATELVFNSPGGAAVIKVAAISNDPVAGSYATNTEYWYSSNTSVAGMGSLAMTYTSGGFSSRELDTFFFGLNRAYTTGQIVTGGSWTQGTYAAPAGSTARLFSAPDPDDPRAAIGMVVVQDTGSSRLIATVWYKSVRPTSGSVWQAANGQNLTWTLVVDGRGSPTLDPSYIRPGSSSWYYIAMP